MFLVLFKILFQLSMECITPTHGCVPARTIRPSELIRGYRLFYSIQSYIILYTTSIIFYDIILARGCDPWSHK